MKRVRTKRFAVVAAACLLLAGWRVGEAHWLNRKDDPSIKAAAEKATVLPESVGGWMGEELDVSAREKEVSGATKITRRRYRPPDGDTVIEVTFLVGPMGPIAVHPPTVCLPSAGWGLQEEVETHVLDIGPQRGRFHAGHFVHVEQSTGVLQRVMLMWGWNDGRGWDVPVNPRWAYAGRPVLWKVYIGIAGVKEEKEQRVQLLAFTRLLLERLSIGRAELVQPSR